MGGDKPEDFIAFFRHLQAGDSVDVDHEHYAEDEKQPDDEKLHYSARDHVFLARQRVAASQMALHHVLVEPVYGDSHEDSGYELLPEICALGGIVEIEDAK